MEAPDVPILYVSRGSGTDRFPEGRLVATLILHEEESSPVDLSGALDLRRERKSMLGRKQFPMRKAGTSCLVVGFDETHCPW